MYSCHYCGLEHILLQSEEDTAWAVGSVSQAHTGQLEEKQLSCLFYGQLARDEMCKGVFNYPMPRCLLAQRSSGSLMLKHLSSAKLSLPSLMLIAIMASLIQQ